MTKDWTASQATWLNAKTNEKWDPSSTDHLKQGGAYTLDGGAEIPYGPDEQWEIFDVTAIVKFMLANPAQNFGFLAVDDESSGHSQRLYASSDYTDNPSQKPKLTIEHTAGISYFPNIGPRSKVNLRVTGQAVRFSMPSGNSRAIIRNARGQTIASIQGTPGSDCEIRLDAFGTGIHFLTIYHDNASKTAKFFVIN